MANTVALGDRPFYATMDYDPVYGEITINILDENGRPSRAFSAEEAKAILVPNAPSPDKFRIAYLTQLNQAVVR